MKRIAYRWVEMRTILVPNEVCINSYGEMIRDIRNKTATNFTGKEEYDFIQDGVIRILVEKADTRDWEIVSVDPTPKETAIEKARRLVSEARTGQFEGTVKTDWLKEIIDTFEQAYKEDAGE